MALQNKRIVVIGGSSGIGFACAALCVDKGADVHIASRSEDRLQQAVDALGSGSCSSWVLDFTQEKELEKVFTAIGHFDHLLTPAVAFDAGGLLDQSSDDARATMESKFWGQYLSAKHGAPRINEGGSILFFSGVAGCKPIPGYSAAAAACGAIESLGLQLSRELAPLRINTISPGFIDTPIHDHLPIPDRQAVFSAVAETLPLKRVGLAEEVAHTAIYLMENGYTTGTTVFIDGGLKNS